MRLVGARCLVAAMQTNAALRLILCVNTFWDARAKASSHERLLLFTLIRAHFIARHMQQGR